MGSTGWWGWSGLWGVWRCPDILETAPVPQDSLEQARELIEALPLAELDNVLPDPCLDTESLVTAVQLNQVDPSGSSDLSNRTADPIEVIFSLPNQPLPAELNKNYYDGSNTVIPSVGYPLSWWGTGYRALRSVI